MKLHYRYFRFPLSKILWYQICWYDLRSQYNCPWNVYKTATQSNITRADLHRLQTSEPAFNNRTLILAHICDFYLVALPVLWNSVWSIGWILSWPVFELEAIFKEFSDLSNYAIANNCCSFWLFLFLWF